MLLRYQLLILCILISASSSAQTTIDSGLWIEKQEKSIQSSGNRLIVPNYYKTFELNEENLYALLNEAPHEDAKNVTDSETIIEIPLSDGTVEEFQIVEYDIAEAELYEKFPEIGTFYGRGTKNPMHRIRLDKTSAGFRAMMSIPGKGYAFIDPYAHGDTKHYVSYFKKDYPLPSEPFQCGVDDYFEEKMPASPNGAAKAGDCTFRSYRLAMAVTGEYSNYFGVTSAAGQATILAEVINSVNRVNEVYESDFAIRLILIGNTENVFYYDGSTDPFTNNNGVAMLGENKTNMTAVIGDANFDIGHVYSTGGGGIAQLFSPCSSNKARGVTGRFAPTGDPFWIDYVSHEIGHQFGGNHTQNNDCNRTSQSFEPGSGSTIMGYAGICNPNIQSNSDPYFHGANIMEVANFVTGPGNSCATVIANPNTAPTVNAGADYTVPASTPLVLTATGNDADGDALSYCWEQFDNTPATMPPVSTNTAGPAFRSFNPSSSPSRYLPALNTVINNGSTTWEVLPSVSRTMNWRVTARDNSTNAAGCTAEDDMIITVDGTAGPFLVTSPTNANITWLEGESKTITWNVANTNGGSINCANVDILLSTDGGLSYPTTLASGVTNDGMHSIVVPSGTTNTARVKIQCSDNIFYDISDNNFAIQAGGPTFTMEVVPPSRSICAGETPVFVINTNSLSGFSGVVSLSSSNVPSGASLNLSSSSIAAGGNATATLANTGAISSGTYTINIQATSGGITRNADISLTVNNVPGAISLTTPSNGATEIATIPTLSWSAIAGVTAYQIQISDNASFSTIVTDENTTNTSFTQSNTLAPSTVYYWRVKGKTPCEGPWSATRSFTTKNCLTLINNITYPIAATGTPTITSPINIGQAGTLQSLVVKNINGTHSWVSDIDAVLISPIGTRVALFNDLCNNNDDFNIGLDMSATNPVSSATCNPLGGGDMYIPTGNLSTLNGQSITGNWTLELRDDTSQDGGSLTSWKLEICFAAILPVELTNFTAEGRAKDIRLDWTTSNEIDNAGFEIERRAEYETNFSYIGKVEATDTPSPRNFYDFIDEDVNAGITYFYRLRQLDIDGTATYSEVKSAKLKSKAADFSVFPNPASSTVFVKFNDDSFNRTELKLYNLQGQLLKTSTFTGLSTEMAVSDLPSGVYLLEIQNGKNVFVEKLRVEN